MDKLVIEGGVPLTGVIEVSGAKNAALPILFASILLDGPVRISNVPDLRDIHTTLKLLNLLGCACDYQNGCVEARPGDLLLTVGAGDVTELAGTVLGDLAAREGGAAPSPADRDERA